MSSDDERSDSPESDTDRAPSEDEIAELAYQIFLSPDRGSAEDNWLRAEAELRLGPALRRSARPHTPPTE